MNIQTSKVKELPAHLQVPVVPRGMVSVSNLAELGDCSVEKVRWRCRKSGVNGVNVKRVNVNGDFIGGRMLCYPKEAALDAVLGKEEQ